MNPGAERRGGTPTSAVKSVLFAYEASNDLHLLFEGFRSMCNDAIRIAIREKPKNRFKLIKFAYLSLKVYGLHTHYILSACEVAYSLYRNKKRKGVPCVRKAFLKLDNQSYQLNHLLLRIPTSPRNFVFLKLEASAYHLSFIDEPSLRRGSVTVTEEAVSIAFSKEIKEFEPVGYLGVDINERNVTVSGTEGYFKRFEELAEVAEIKERYREARAKIGRVISHDNRIGKRLLEKYGRRERNRTSQRIHTVTKRIADYAARKGLGIKMEKLTGIRKRYRRGNGQGNSFRGRMNAWVFGETQRQTDYKARWEGVPVRFINPKGTSSNCPDCGSLVAPLQDRKLYCGGCDRTWDRDDLASKNIMACVVPQARPPKGSNEGDEAATAQILQADEGKGILAVGDNRDVPRTIWIPSTSWP